MTAFLVAHRRILLLKAAVAAALVASHYAPAGHPITLVTNLIWLILF